jgi:P pilus assembly chaperone PapD
MIVELLGRFPLPWLTMVAAALMIPASPARAELVLSQLVVELGTPGQQRSDIEIWNNSEERAYVSVEPSEIVDPGTPAELRRSEADPEKRGLLVSPTRMILEPGQRRQMRFAPVGPREDRERVYRVTVKPVAGPLSAAETGLKLLIGYDVLVLLRPADLRQNLVARRVDGRLTFRNEGNASLELIDGRQCVAGKTNCTPLPGKRLYAGAEWSQELPSTAPVDYTVVSNGQPSRKTY